MSVPGVRQRRLGSALRQLRERAGMTGPQVDEAISYSKSMLSRVEKGSRIPNEEDLSSLLVLYGVTDTAERAKVIDLWHVARRRDWLMDYKDIFSLPFRDYLALEPEAHMILNYQPQYVPGLLQTVPYMRAMLASPRNIVQVDRKASIRIQRQQILWRESPPRLVSIIDESALHRPVGGRAVLREQLAYLAEMAEMPSVQVQILPYENQIFAASPFSMLHVPDPGGMVAVFLENLADEAFIDTVSGAQAHSVVYERLQGAALSIAESIERISQALEELKLHD